MMGLCFIGSRQELILEEIYQGVRKLETFNILDILDNFISKVANTVGTTKKMWIQVGWIDKVIREINARRDHVELLCEA